MAKAGKTRGWYTFEDGYYVWLNGLSSNEKMILVRQHGDIVKFEHTS